MLGASARPAAGRSLSDAQLAGTRVITGFTGAPARGDLGRGGLGVILFDGTSRARSVRRSPTSSRRSRPPGPPLVTSPGGRAGEAPAAEALREGRSAPVREAHRRAPDSGWAERHLAPSGPGTAGDRGGATFARKPGRPIGGLRGLAAGGCAPRSTSRWRRVNTTAVQNRLPGPARATSVLRGFVGAAVVMLSTAISGPSPARSHGTRSWFGSDHRRSLSARAFGAGQTAAAAAAAGTDLVLFTDLGSAAPLAPWARRLRAGSRRPLLPAGSDSPSSPSTSRTSARAGGSSMLHLARLQLEPLEASRRGVGSSPLIP